MIPYLPGFTNLHTISLRADLRDANWEDLQTDRYFLEWPSILRGCSPLSKFTVEIIKPHIGEVSFRKIWESHLKFFRSKTGVQSEKIGKRGDGIRAEIWESKADEGQYMSWWSGGYGQYHDKSLIKDTEFELFSSDFASLKIDEEDGQFLLDYRN